MKKRLVAGTAMAGLVAGVFTYQTVFKKDTYEIEHENILAQVKAVPLQNAEESITSASRADSFSGAILSPELPDFDAVDDMPMAEKETDSAAYSLPNFGAAKKQKIAADAIAPIVSSPPVGNYNKAERKRLAIAPGLPHQPYPGEGRVQAEQPNGDKFSQTELNSIKQVAKEPVSTVSVDVDTASYSYVRRTINSGQNINKNSVRIEELINYFDYDYPYPQNSTTPFKPSMSVFPTPWNENTKLLHIGIKGYDIQPEQKPRSNLVFLIDVSGSMSDKDKLPLLKNAFRLLVENLDPDDTVSVVTYAGYSGTALHPTKASNKARILSVIDSLGSGGSTAGAQGIRQAYALAESNFDKEGVNRIILATDGDFNVGMTNHEQLKKLVEEKRKNGVFLSILGFGRGNYNDQLMQVLAQNGNGNAAYIDNLNEARKVLVQEASSTLFPIAKDVKIQIEFNPNLVSEYRLIGYETRMLKREDFNNDKVDAGDIGSGHTVTAIYEITPAGSKAKMVDDLRYQKEKVVDNKVTTTGNNTEYAFLKMRYKLPKEDKSKLIEIPVNTSLEYNHINQTSTEVRFATAVAAFGQKIRKESFVNSMPYDNIIKLAQGSTSNDKFGYRSEFINLVRLAKSLHSGSNIDCHSTDRNHPEYWSKSRDCYLQKRNSR